MAADKRCFTVGYDDPRYEVLGLLGQGGFGSVAKVLRREDGKLFACKTLKIRKPTDIDAWENEYGTLWEVRACRNVVQWSEDFSADVVRLEARLYMTYYPDGSLRDILQNKQRLNVWQVLGIFAGVAMAFVDCHKLGIIHRDIKPENILVSKCTWGSGVDMLIPHVADFGIAKVSTIVGRSAQTVLGTGIGTERYMAPESLNPHAPTFGPKSDVFSLGCVIWEIVHQVPAFNGSTRSALPSPPSCFHSFSNHGAYELTSQLTNRCMALSPAERISAAQLLEALEKLTREAMNGTNLLGSFWRKITVLGQAEPNKKNASALQRFVVALASKNVDNVRKLAATELVSRFMLPDAQLQPHEIETISAQCKRFRFSTKDDLLFSAVLDENSENGIAEALAKNGLNFNYVASEGDNAGRSFLEAAIRKRAPDSKIALLLQNGVNPDLPLSNGDAPLIFALQKSFYSHAVKPLLENGADPNVCNSEDQAAITIAVGYNRSLEIIKTLIKSGADLNPTTRCPPLIQAAQSTRFQVDCKSEAIEALLEGGADPNLPLHDDNGQRLMLPLYGAARYGRFPNEIAQVGLLLQYGADPNGARRDGVTALHGAAENDDVDFAVKACRLIVAAGADVNAKEYDMGYTPLDLAEEKRRTELIETLKNCGAKSREPRNFLARNAYEGYPYRFTPRHTNMPSFATRPLPRRRGLLDRLLGL